jgi:hypothetical protein
MTCLGTYEYPRPWPAQLNPYPWVAAEVGDWWLVVAPDARTSARNSVRACGWRATKRYTWEPKFVADNVSDNVVRVVRVK